MKYLIPLLLLLPLLSSVSFADEEHFKQYVACELRPIVEDMKKSEKLNGARYERKNIHQGSREHDCLAIIDFSVYFKFLTLNEDASEETRLVYGEIAESKFMCPDETCDNIDDETRLKFIRTIHQGVRNGEILINLPEQRPKKANEK